ncbi:MAG: Antitoxin of toxin-antitoxin stability system [Pseudolabrys sp.]|jgi:prevent-host-death family protein|nr:Antitoxin of toxin-antitoxin stability system [Pseudolabrys sp.]
MQIPVSDAKGQLTELVRRAEAGDEVILTRHGKAAVRLVPVAARPTNSDKRALMSELRRGARRAAGGTNAARSQDFLYDKSGLPK